MALATAKDLLAAHHSAQAAGADETVMHPWRQVAPRGARKQRHQAPLQRASLMDYYWPPPLAVAPWQEERRNKQERPVETAPKWYCGACGCAHHNASLRRCRLCKEERPAAHLAQDSTDKRQKPAADAAKLDKSQADTPQMPAKLRTFAEALLAKDGDQPAASEGADEAMEEPAADQPPETLAELQAIRASLLKIHAQAGIKEIDSRIAKLQKQAMHYDRDPKVLVDQAAKYADKWRDRAAAKTKAVEALQKQLEDATKEMDEAKKERDRAEELLTKAVADLQAALPTARVDARPTGSSAAALPPPAEQLRALQERFAAGPAAIVPDLEARFAAASRENTGQQISREEFGWRLGVQALLEALLPQAAPATAAAAQSSAPGHPAGGAALFALGAAQRGAPTPPEPSGPLDRGRRRSSSRSEGRSHSRSRERQR